MITLEEIRRTVGGTADSPTPAPAQFEALSLRDLQRKVGILPEDGNSAARTETSLEEIRRQISQRYISDAEEIRMILKNTLWRPADNIEAHVSNWLGTHFRNVQENSTKKSVAIEDITLLDVWVLVDWASIHLEKYMFAKNIRNELLEMAKKDIWFANLLNISITALIDFPDFNRDNGFRSVTRSEIQNSYFSVFGRDITIEDTVGDVLKQIRKTLKKSWWLNIDINEYREDIISCGRLIYSIIHMVCAGYVNIDDRVSESNYPYRSLKDCLRNCSFYTEDAGVLKE